MSYSLIVYFKEPATPEIFTLSLHDALPISGALDERADVGVRLSVRSAFAEQDERALRRLEQIDGALDGFGRRNLARRDRKSTRLNSSHSSISYAVSSLKKTT